MAGTLEMPDHRGSFSFDYSSRRLADRSPIALYRFTSYGLVTYDLHGGYVDASPSEGCACKFRHRR
jgi:hypothetical protein